MVTDTGCVQRPGITRYSRCADRIDKRPRRESGVNPVEPRIRVATAIVVSREVLLAFDNVFQGVAPSPAWPLFRCGRLCVALSQWIVHCEWCLTCCKKIEVTTNPNHVFERIGPCTHDVSFDASGNEADVLIG